MPSILFLLRLEMVPLTARGIVCSPMLVNYIKPLEPLVGSAVVCHMLVRKHDPETPGVAGRRNGGFAQVPFAFFRFVRQYVAGIGVAPLDFSRAGLFESFGHAFVCLHFGHKNPSEGRTRIFN